MRLLREIGVFVWESLKVFGLYLLFVAVFPPVVMFIEMSVGYLPYSDRPGPGWYGFHPNFSVGVLEWCAGFALGVALFSLLIYLLGPFASVIAAALLRTRLPWWALAILYVPIFGIPTLWIYAAYGWYEALDAITPLVALGASVVFAVLLPYRARRFATRKPQPGYMPKQ